MTSITVYQNINKDVYIPNFEYGEFITSKNNGLHHAFTKVEFAIYDDIEFKLLKLYLSVDEGYFNQHKLTLILFHLHFIIKKKVTFKFNELDNSTLIVKIRSIILKNFEDLTRNYDRNFDFIPDTAYLENFSKDYNIITEINSLRRKIKLEKVLL